MRAVTIIPSAGQPQVIFDGTKFPYPDSCQDGFNPSTERQFQQTPLFRGANPFVADRFNALQKWDITVTHTFATYMLCQDFIGARAGLPRVGEIMLLTKTSQSTFTRYLQGATLRAIAVAKENGTTVIYKYTIHFTNYSVTP